MRRAESESLPCHHMLRARELLPLSYMRQRCSCRCPAKMLLQAAQEAGLGGAELAERVHTNPRFQNLVGIPGPVPLCSRLVAQQPSSTAN